MCGCNRGRDQVTSANLPAPQDQQQVVTDAEKKSAMVAAGNANSDSSRR